jgi:hypothetical protein
MHPYCKSILAWIHALTFLLLLPACVTGQQAGVMDTAIINPSGGKAKPSMKDTLDGKLDFSRFLIDANGFIPVPIIITEPALGSFGALLAPMFLKPKTAPPGYKVYIPPDITAAVAMYTVNGSWMLGAGRIGSIPKAGIKYRAALAYADINLSFYRSLPSGNEQEFEFNIEAVPLFLSLSKRITRQDLYLGLQYFFSDNKLKPRFSEDLPESIKPEEFNSKVASLGIFLDWDKRDNFFTANKGTRINVLFSANDNWTGSDFTYQRLGGYVNWFLPIKKNWVSGLRLDAQHAFGDPPFYALPSITLRGVPAVRFQGYTTSVLETEQRWDFSQRWSVLGFAGIGKAWQRNQEFGEGANVYNIGTGFRYLLARAFGIRAGIDVAKGTDSWGWYITFGHNWNR